MRILFLTSLYYMFALSSFLNPFYGVIGYTFISVIRPEQLTWGISNIKNVFAVAIVSLLISCIVRSVKLLNAVKQPFFICFFLFVGGLYFSTLTSAYTVLNEARGSFYYLRQLPQILVFCICLYAVLTRMTSNQQQQYIAIALFFITFMGLWGIDQSLRGNINVEGLFGYDRDVVTAVFVLYLPIAYFFLSFKKSLLKWFGVVSLLVCFVLIILTGSRAGFLGLLIDLLLIFLYSKNKALCLQWLFMLLMLGLVVTPKGFFDRFAIVQKNILSVDEISDFSSASRLLLWKVALDMIADNPLLGVGNLNFIKANQTYAAPYERIVERKLYDGSFGSNGEGGLMHTHNTFLNILVEGGLVSAIPFFLLFIIPLRNGLKLYKRYHDKKNEQMELLAYINFGIAGILVVGVFGTLTMVDYMYWNLTLSCVISQKLEERLDTVSI